jgi:hypothetical protein
MVPGGAKSCVLDIVSIHRPYLIKKTERDAHENLYDSHGWNYHPACAKHSTRSTRLDGQNRSAGASQGKENARFFESQSVRRRPVQVAVTCTSPLSPLSDDKRCCESFAYRNVGCSMIRVHFLTFIRPSIGMGIVTWTSETVQARGVDLVY